MAIEVAGEHALEAGIVEWQLERIALDQRRMRDAVARDLEHLLALIEPGYVSRQVAREKPRTAGDVERAGGRQPCERLLERPHGLLPARTLAQLEKPLAQIPLVVLEGAGVVV